MSKKESGLVYSSEWGKMCPGCEKPVAQCVCRRSGNAVLPAKDGIVRVSRETKGRKGAGVTIISGLPGSEDDLKKLAAELKKKCGAGGAIKDGQIEIQGEHRDRLVAELDKMGYRVKRSGG
ncbi:MAG: stress response translation initiation inhibitor YciH [Candidatus Riflebacteria bacterium HGW-Riflebacteria-2]|jgi:translation initiation factor 1|nr:MAG: stress response translation initiation inhibitor YciH [Candidatus Riflebacteria bacterium HGW-Riflebacteria-2]